MRKFKRLTMTLALLLTAVTGAWAQETPLLTIESKDYTSFTSGSKTFDDKVTVTFSKTVYNDGNDDGWYGTISTTSLLTVAGTNGYTITSCKFYTKNGTASTGYTIEGENPSVYLSYWTVYTDANQSEGKGTAGVTKIEVYGTAPAAEPTEWSLTPDQTGKTWTLDKMPASNIELQVEYFAESNLFLSKDALADKANIAVKAGDLGLQFGDDGKSANTVTEGSAMTVKYNGTKKLLGMKVEKKAPALLSIQIGGHVTATIYYFEGETWEQAIQNHPEENSAWKNNQGHISGNGVTLFAGDNFVIVNPNDTIDPNTNYYLLWT